MPGVCSTLGLKRNPLLYLVRGRGINVAYITSWPRFDAHFIQLKGGGRKIL